MKNAKPCDTPASSEKKYPYGEAVESLLYLSTRTRPDIAQAVNLVSKKVETPNREDVTKVKIIFKYLVRTKEKERHFVQTKQTDIEHRCFQRLG
ncbi:unnamed protein product [Pieris brassicae]|uniref:Uncharacterized protein n=1 Tax=Pieris brassicae TaxID=7116 RepID=A0A9P0TTW5_PIEBR|nr:unnamed protein product [Pieris brassicae]